MISKQLSVILNHNRRCTQKLNIVTKQLLNTNSSINNFYHINAIQLRNLEKCLISNGGVRQTHLQAKEKLPCSGIDFARYVMENSEAYSKYLSPTLPFDQNLQTDELESILQKQWISMSITEILQNFEQISTYIVKSEESINYSKYQGIFEVIKNNISNFNDQEIHRLLSCLELWKFRKTVPPIIQDLTKTVDNECLKRMPKWTLEEILLTNDQFYKLGISRFLEFTWKSLKKIGSKFKKFSPANFVQYAFFLKVNRKLPIHMYEMELYVDKNFDSFTVEELGIIFNAFCTYEVPIRNHALLIKVTKKLNSNIDNVNDYTLNSIISILRFGLDPELVQQLNILLEKLEHQIDRLHIHTVANIMLMKIKILIYNEKLILKILERCEKEIKNIKLKDIEKIFYGLHVFNCDPSIERLFSLTYKELLDPSRAEVCESSPNRLVQIVSFMLKQQFYPEEILKRIMDPDYIDKISGGNVYRLNTKYLDIDYCIDLEYPKYDGPRVREDIINFLLKHYGAQQSIKLRKHMKINHVDKLTNEIAHIIKKIANSDAAVEIHSVLPHITKNWIIIRSDPETKELLPLSEKLSAIPMDRIKYAPDDGKNWYILIIASHSAVTRDESHRLTGPLTSNIRQLELIGYKPIVIRQQEWLNLTDEATKQKYINELLFR